MSGEAKKIIKGNHNTRAYSCGISGEEKNNIKDNLSHATSRKRVDERQKATSCIMEKWKTCRNMHWKVVKFFNECCVPYVWYPKSV